MGYLQILKNHTNPSLSAPSESTLPLLPLQNANGFTSAEDGWERTPDTASRRTPTRLLRSRARCAAIAAGIGVILVCAGILIPGAIRPTSAPPPTSPPHTTQSPSAAAQAAVDALYARQSTTLEQASARYSLRTDRPPPPNYDRWFDFAREKSCLIDEYDRVHRDFKPFYQLARRDPRIFQDMIDRATRVLDSEQVGIGRVEIRDGEVELSMSGYSAYADWQDNWRHFSSGLPNMTFLINSHDEPRVAFNYREPSALQRALSKSQPPTDPKPFQIRPLPGTSKFFAEQSGCNVPMEASGFMKTANNDSGFLIATAEPGPGYTTDLYPMLSMTKVSPCFADILYPTMYYYQRSWWSGKFAHPDDVPWEGKKGQLYWRGMSNGGMIIDSNYHHYARFKLIDIGRAHPALMDVAITLFAETLCGEGCNRTAIMEEYNITKEGQPRENLYNYKYAMDVDGTTFSGRFLGLLRSGSLVFKSTIFEEYFNDWIRPYEHYIPVLPDLSDLVEKIEWANANPEEAHSIQLRGAEVARRVMTDDQNDCYYFAVLLEWAQLQSYARNIEGAAGQR
ncbi:CAP10 domain-containing protein [Favolaschia claudopus]|uniref:CAP10 domain-containing protein n=1 Tax=Favolaschia claudopus TaxID=2862362 RepID=A0AAW0DM99_9AGAR